MNRGRIIRWSIVIALGGFLFGSDTAVISGAEQDIQKLWNLSVFEHGLTVSIALIGTVIGAMLGGIPTDRLGRKKTLFWIAVIFLVSAIGSALAIDWYTFLFFRFVGGLGVGCSSVTAPMYISELAPASYRGRLVAMFQFNVVLGILIAIFIKLSVTGYLPFITAKLGGGNSFMLFAFMMVLQLIFVWKVMPETKGRSLEFVDSKTTEVQESPELIKTT